MNAPKALGAAALGLLVTCAPGGDETPTQQPPAPTACDELRAQFAIGALLTQVALTPGYARKLGSNPDEIFADSDNRLRAAIGNVENPVECLEEGGLARTAGLRREQE